MKQSKKIDKYLDVAREQKKAMEYESHGDTYCIQCSWNSPQKPGKEIGGAGYQRKNWDY